MDGDAVVQQALKLGASYADLRMETVEENRVQREDGELRSLVSGSETGFAIRVLVGGAWGMASGNQVGQAEAAAGLKQAIAIAKAASRQVTEKVELAQVPILREELVWKPLIDPRHVAPEDKIALLRDMESAVRKVPDIHSVTTSAADATVRKELWTSEGAHVRWGLTRTIVSASYTARRGRELAERGTRVGGTGGWEIARDGNPVARAVEDAKSAVAALGAPAAKGGKTTVVIDPALAGVFAHEAVGHASEADLIAAGESCFKGRLGEQLGNPMISIRDDSTHPGGFGSFPIDDEGVRGRSRPILEQGVLVGLLSDRQQAARLGVPAVGSARAQSFSHRPHVRMSNTLIAPGDRAEEELFEGVKDGVYCKGSRGGQVDCARGTFLFNAQEAFRIENGRVTTPLRDVSLTGDILGTLHGIDALSKTAHLGEPGHCGKGQWVPVCDGGPLVRIQDCLVGGAS